MPARSDAARRLTTLTIVRGARLLVVAPHPDDEVLAAGGLIQRVHALGGAVRIVYLTDGEGYTAGVRVEERSRTVTAADYREYGRLRQEEARRALKRLGVDRDALTFLGFPNNGLSRLMTTYWSERQAAFLSPYTRRDRPRPNEVVLPETKFRGEDLTQELAQIIGTFEPTMIAAPRKEDQHVDHCAAWYFVGDALGDVRRVRSAFRTDLLTDIVHFYSWPFEKESTRLPPPDLSGGLSGWLNLRLTPEETAAKRDALRAYQSQMKMMDWFLLGFARTNEIFSRPPRARIVLPVTRDPCAQFAEPVGATEP